MPDLIEMKVRPHAHAEDGFCIKTGKDGNPCRRRAVAFDVCISHLRSIGGHLFIFDANAPDLRNRHSYCRACAAVKDDATALELCPARRNDPGAPCPTSPDLPSRLQYKFAKPERTEDGVACGPFLARSVRNGPPEKSWLVTHLPSKAPVATLDSERASAAFMRTVCKEGAELDFRDPMKMDTWARFHITMAIRYFRKGACARVPGGVLTWTAKRAYWRTRDQTHLYWQSVAGKIECWGPFAFQRRNERVCLWPLDEPRRNPCFVAPSSERAIAFAKAAAERDLDWYCSSNGFEPATRDAVGQLLEAFPDVACLRRDLASELPRVPGMKPTKVTLATDRGSTKVAGYVVKDHFAVHRPLNPKDCGFVLTHLPTGRLMGNAETIPPLLAAVDELAGMGDWGFSNAAHVPDELRSKPVDVMRKHGVIVPAAGITIQFVM